MSDNTQEKLDQCRRHQQMMGGGFSGGATLDEILTIVRGLKAQEEIVRSNREQVLQAQKRAEDSVDWAKEATANGSWAALTAWGLLQDAVAMMTWDDTHRKSPKGINARKEWVTRYNAWVMECRERGVWSETEDPYYDPNSECGG